MDRISSTSSILKSSLGRKFLLSILVVSSLVTLVLTAIQIYNDYSTELNFIHKELDEIPNKHLQSLSRSIWFLNQEQVTAQLNGILNIPDVVHIELETNDMPAVKVKKDEIQQGNIERDYELFFNNANISQKVGTLKVRATTYRVNQKMMRKFLIVFISQSAKTFLVSFFILVIFQRLIGDPIYQISMDANSLSLDNLDKEIQTPYGVSSDDKNDELNLIVQAINSMRLNLMMEVEKLRTEQRERSDLEKRFFEKQKMEAMGTLASGIAHDFNNILQGVYNAFAALEIYRENPENYEKYMDLGKVFAKRGKELIEKILIYSRNDKVSFEYFNLVEALEESAKMIRLTGKQSFDLIMDVEEDCYTVLGSKGQLQQVFINLGINALHAMEEQQHKELTFKVRSEDKKVIIEVKDIGEGIPPDVIEKMFDPFFTTKEIGKGTGLGLSVVQGIIQGHKGNITVKSKVGSGTTFKITLDLADKELLENNIAEEIKTDSFPNKKYSIVFVDDEKEALPLYEGLLKREGYDVHLFSDPIKAAQALNGHEIEADLLISDYFMPGMNGFELAKSISRKNPMLPVLIITGFHEEDQEVPKNIKAILDKPFSRVILLKKMKELLQESQA